MLSVLLGQWDAKGIRWSHIFTTCEVARVHTLWKEGKI